MVGAGAGTYGEGMPRRDLATCSIVATALAATACASHPDRSDPGDPQRGELAWSGELRIGAPDDDPAGPDHAPHVAVNRAGDAMVVAYATAAGGDPTATGSSWARRYRRADDAFDPRAQLTDGPRWPTVGIDDAGNAIVAGISGGDVTAARFDASGGWPAGWGGSASVGYGTFGGLAVTGDGQAAVSLGQVGSIEAPGRGLLVSYTPAAGWTSKPVFINDMQGWKNEFVASPPALTSSAVVTAMLYRPTRNSGDFKLQAYSTLAGKSFTAPPVTPIATAAAISASGVGLVSAQGMLQNGERHLVVASSTDGTWVQMDSGGLAGAGTMDMDATGDAVIAWRECATTCAIRARHLVAGAWQPAVALSSADVDVGTEAVVDVAMDDRGRAIAVWTQPVAGVTAIFASELGDDGTSAWTPSHPLTPHDGVSRTDPDVDVGADGVAVAVWLRGARTCGAVLGAQP
jgi:hypothetical protein